MRPDIAGLRAVLRGVPAFATILALTSGAGRATPAKPHPVVVSLDPATAEYMLVLDGPPATASMHSGFVVLGPGESVGRHSTGGYEEAVIVLEGRGLMVTSLGDSLPLAKWSVAYCPPETEHDVTNTGAEPLRYVYLVAVAPTGGK